MRIGFDSKRLFNNFTGLGNYSRSLVKNLHEYYPENKYHLYTPKFKNRSETSYFLDNSSFQTYDAKVAFKSFWRSYSIIQQLKKDEIDLYHGLSNEIPFSLKKSNIQSVVTIHDLIFKVLPETYSQINRKIYDFKFRNSCLSANRVIAISESTKNDIVRFYNIDPEKIEVIYQSCNPIFYKKTEKEESIEILNQHKIPSEYLLFVGSIEERKNLNLIIEAYQKLKEEFRIPLVVIGRDKGYRKNILKLVEEYKLGKKVIWISNLNDNDELRVIYQKAMMLIYPSFYEGFGLPVAEALISKTPVITSNVSSLPEAGGPNSYYVDPNNPEELAHGITQVLINTELRETMIDRGYQYACKQFSPDQVTKQLVDCYGRVLNSAGSK